MSPRTHQSPPLAPPARRQAAAGRRRTTPPPAHQGDVLLIEPRVAIGHLLDPLLRAHGVHLYPVVSLEAAASAGEVFSFGVVVIDEAALETGVDVAIERLRTSPGLRRAAIVRTGPQSPASAASGRPMRLPRPLDPHGVSRCVLDALSGDAPARGDGDARRRGLPADS